MLDTRHSNCSLDSITAAQQIRSKTASLCKTVQAQSKHSHHPHRPATRGLHVNPTQSLSFWYKTIFNVFTAYRPTQHTPPGPSSTTSHKPYTLPPSFRVSRTHNLTPTRTQHLTMARNGEKAQSMLYRFREQQAADMGVSTRKAGDRRPRIAASVSSLHECERWRGDVLKEISRKVTKIQDCECVKRYLRGFVFPSPVDVDVDVQVEQPAAGWLLMMVWRYGGV